MHFTFLSYPSSMTRKKKKEFSSWFFLISSILENVPAFYFPVIWFEQKATIPFGLHFLLKTFLHLQLILRCVGGVLLIIGVPWLMFLLNRPFMRKMSWKRPKDPYTTVADVSLKGIRDFEKPLMECTQSKELDER